MTTTRSTYRIEQIRAEDLADVKMDEVVIMIEGRWREIVQVWEDGGGGEPLTDWDQVRAAEETQGAGDLLGGIGEFGPINQILVEYRLTGRRLDDPIFTSFVLIDRVDLVDIQVENVAAGPLEGF